MFQNNSNSGIPNSFLTCHSITEKLLDNLMSEELHLYQNLNNIIEKVQYVETLMYEHKLLPEICNTIPKCNVKSMEYSKKGDASIRTGNTTEAFENYNKCIAFAQNNTEALSNAFTKRSRLFSRLKRDNECIDDVNLSIQYEQCPGGKYIKMLECIKKDSENIIKNDKNILSTSTEFIRDLHQINNLTYTKHPQIPYIINHLIVHDLPDYGRSIITMCNLKPGDVITIEKPFISVLHKSFEYKRCTNCLKQTFSLIPCPLCTSAMFCSEKCYKTAYRKFHKFECNAIDFIFDTFDNARIMSIRLIIQIISLFGGDISRLMDFLEKTKNDTNQIGIDFNVSFDAESNNDIGGGGGGGAAADDDDDENYINHKDYAETIYYPINRLIRDVERPHANSEDLFLIVLTVIANNVLRQIFPKCIRTKQHINFVTNFIFHQLKLETIYSNELKNYNSIDNNTDDYLQTFGQALYPFSGLINHSCAPNVLRIQNGSTVSIVVLRPIQNGEQLLESYSYSGAYWAANKSDRQFALTRQYNIECKCEACENDAFRLASDLPLNLNLPIVSDSDVLTSMENLMDIVEYIKKYVKFLKEYSNKKNYPCSQICRVEIELERCLNYCVGHRTIDIYNKILN